MPLTITTRHPFAERVRQMVRKHRLIEAGDRVLVAVSGGPDSMALVSVLLDLAPSLDLQLGVVHFHHGLRGAEADGDEAFVAEFARTKGLPYQVERLDVRSQVVKGRSLQATARELRYAVLSRLSEDRRWTKVAMGHTRDDQAETVLMRLIRGAGSAGAAGIPWSRPPVFVRPLLASSRADILHYLADRGLTYRRDSSNESPAYLRNRIRHRLLPVLREFNPSIVEVLSRHAELVREDDHYLDDLARGAASRLRREEAPSSAACDISALLALPLALRRRVLRQVLARVMGRTHAPSFAAVAAALRCAEGRPGRSVVIHGVRITRAKDMLHLRGAGSCSESGEGLGPCLLSLTVPGTLFWPPTDQHITANLLHWGRDMTPQAGTEPHRVLVDADRLTHSLVVRTWSAGDRMRPLGMHGRQKKLQDLFTDSRVPVEQRVRLPLVVAPEGIVWVAGLRIDHRFRMTAKTTRVLELTVHDHPLP